MDGYDQLSWNHGKHTIMAGVELRKLTIGRQATNDPRGSFTFSGAAPTDTGYTSTGYGAADFVLGLAQKARRLRFFP